MGAAGAHQMYNHTDKPCQYMELSIDIGMHVCVYPDSGKINVIGEGLRQIHIKSQSVGYFDKEENVRDKWEGNLSSEK